MESHPLGTLLLPCNMILWVGIVFDTDHISLTLDSLVCLDIWIWYHELVLILIKEIQCLYTTNVDHACIHWFPKFAKCHELLCIFHQYSWLLGGIATTPQKIWKSAGKISVPTEWKDKNTTNQACIDSIMVQ